MKAKLFIWGLFLFTIQSCTYHFFVKDDKFVRTQQGYLLFFEEIINLSDTGIIYDEYTNKRNKKGDVSSVFFKSDIDTTLLNYQLIDKLKNDKNVIEFGKFCERSTLLNDLSDTLAKTKSGVFYFIPVKLSFLNIHERKSFHKIVINLGNGDFEINVSDASFQLINAEPLFSQHQYDAIKNKMLMKEKAFPPY